MNVTYSNINGYQIPNLIIKQPAQEIGLYGRQRMAFLREHDPLTYEEMLLDGTLYAHLAEIDHSVRQLMEQTMTKLLKASPAPDRRTNPLAWVQHMNSIKAQAEEAAKQMLYEL